MGLRPALPASRFPEGRAHPALPAFTYYPSRHQARPAPHRGRARSCAPAAPACRNGGPGRCGRTRRRPRPAPGEKRHVHKRGRTISWGFTKTFQIEFHCLFEVGLGFRNGFSLSVHTQFDAESHIPIFFFGDLLGEFIRQRCHHLVLTLIV
jgi:hypothetical protein